MIEEVKKEMKQIMKLIDIKGKRDYIRFIMEDGTYVKGTGEMLMHGFCVYEKTLRLVIDDAESKELTASGLIELKTEISRLTTGTNFKVFFE